MYEQHPSFKPIDESARIWRYLDFTKFVSLLNEEALFFCRADKLDDPFEGTFTKSDIEEIYTAFDRHKLPSSDANTERYNDFLESKKRWWLKDSKQMREGTFVNCWYINDYESDAMWKIYGKNGGSVAIQSTFKRLAESFNNYKEPVFIGKVRYIDYEIDKARPTSNSLDPFMAKRKSFEHENELRALVWPLPFKPGTFEFRNFDEYGVNIPVDLDVLIEKIYVSPTTPQWISKLVESIKNKYGLRKSVEQSSLVRAPDKIPPRKVPEPVKPLLSEVCTAAKSRTLSIYPFDIELVCMFAIECHRIGVEFDDYDFYEHLVAEGVHSKIAEELRGQYCFGLNLLRVHQRGMLLYKDILNKLMNK